MRIPGRNIAAFAKELIDQCGVSREARIERGQMYRNLFLTGDEGGDPATYPRTYAYIDNLSSYLYSPVELRFLIEFYGQASPADRAKGRAVSSDLHRRFRQCGLDTEIEEAVTWGLVKGKTFIKLLWNKWGFEPLLIQPEMMGVLDESKASLDKQEAFCHTVYISPSQFDGLIEFHPDRADLAKKVRRYANPRKGAEETQGNQMLRQVIVGGLYPYQTAGTGGTKPRGMVDWLSGPVPTLAPDVVASLIRLDELWVWDDAQDDWTTIQMVGEDCVIEGKTMHRNIFADALGTDLKLDHTSNPLNGHHPFNEICPNPLNGYFWGRSELCNVALLQQTLNARINGINMLLRLQEKPPRFASGTTALNQNALAKLNKPGGYLTDSNPNAKITSLAPELPPGLYESLHESERMFDHMAGTPPILQGRGEGSVRSQGHADTLTRNASPRFKDRALLIERQIESIGGLGLDMCKAHVPTKLTGWVKPSDASIETELNHGDEIEQAPAPGMKPIEFTYSDLGKDCAVRVDAHSASPAFAHESKQFLFDLVKIGAATPEQLITHLHPPGEDEMVTDLERAAIDKAKMMAQNPELALKAIEGGKGKKKH